MGVIRAASSRTRFRLTRPVAAARGLPLLLLTAAVLPGPPAYAACSLDQLAELPVIMRGLRLLVHAKINGTDALFIADSGAPARAGVRASRHDPEAAVVADLEAADHAAPKGGPSAHAHR